MKTKSITYLLVMLMLASGASTLAIAQQHLITEQTVNLTFTTPTIRTATIDTVMYTQLTIQGANTLVNPGAPAVPMTTTILELPFGTTVSDVSLVPQTIQTMTLTYPVMPSPQLVTKDGQSTTAVVSDSILYSSVQYYPASWFDYSTGGGLNDKGVHTTFLVIRTFPVRVNSVTNTIEYFQNAVITVHYKTPATPKIFGTSGTSYDLLIIAPQVYASILQPLIQEKQSHGINTTLMTLEDIYNKYTGYDKPEQIKYAIKDALETWNIHYVLLVGGMKGYLFGGGGKDGVNSGIKTWYFPVCYTNMVEGGNESDPGFISDLYFADIYNANGSFSSWDSNGNHVYGDWSYGDTNHDIVDLYPDVAVGRLSARNPTELKVLVNKILTYEKTAADPSWFNKMILVGGDTDDDRPDSNFNEGELITSYTHNESMSSFTPIDVFASNRNLSNDFTPTPTNLVRIISQGAGFLFFDGHGNPLSWNTHWHDEFTWGKGKSPGGINILNMMKLTNGDKLPVCVVGGCHNSMINVSLLWTLNPKNTASWCYGEPAFRCWSEEMMAKRHGGAIAVVGATALSYGADGMMDGQPACIEAFGGYIERTFFQAYNESTVKSVGNCWVGSINRYLNTWPGMDNFVDCKTVEEWLTLGDPSLIIGGFS